MPTSVVKLTAREDIHTGIFILVFLWSSSSNFAQMLIKVIWIKVDIITRMKGF